LAKIDIKNAYRSIPISKKNQKVTDLKWFDSTGEFYMVDMLLPFGAKASPGIFSSITQSIKRMMNRKGYHTISVYLDDFALCANPKQDCHDMITCLLKWLRSLGLHINWSKVKGPTQCMSFLIIEIDTVNMRCRLHQPKMQKVLTELENVKACRHL
jgi:hypothetical protein